MGVLHAVTLICVTGSILAAKSNKPGCGLNEFFSDCGSGCVKTCKDPLQKDCRLKKCFSGCFCVSPLVRDDAGRCVSLDQCPGAPTDASPTQSIPDFTCPAVGDGNFEDPRSPCSQFYFECVNGKATFRSCRPGEAFDVVSGLCLNPKFVLWCPGGKSTKEATTPQEPTTTTTKLFTTKGTRATTTTRPIKPTKTRPTRPPVKPTKPAPTPDFDCSNLEDGRYPDPSLLCSRLFYFCVAGIPTQGTCAGGTRFDAETRDCEYRQYVRNCGGNPDNKPSPTPQEPTPSIPPPFKFNCNGLDDGDYENPENGCSKLYVSCSGGITIFRECPGSLAFDVVSGRCLNRAYVPWCPGGKATEIPTTEPPKPADLPEPPFEFDCWGLEDGSYGNPLEKCSQEYVVCVGQSPIFMKCPGRLIFDIWSGNCILSVYAEDCGGKPTPKPTPTKPTSPPADPGFTFDCSERPNGDYENPIDGCSEVYVSCVAGETVFRYCQNGLKYDVVSGMCLEPEFVPWCPGGVATTTQKPKPTLPQSPPFPFDCSNRNDGEYDDPNNACSSNYVACSGGETFYRVCPGFLVYDWDYSRCRNPQVVRGCPGANPEPPIEPEEPRQPHPGFDCTGLDDGAYPNNDCSETYFTCVGEISEEVWCPGALKFDKDTGDCLEMEFIRGCGGTPTKKTPPPKPTPTRPANPPNPECLSRGPGRYAAEKGCTQNYFLCSEDDQRTDEVCHDDLYFDVESQSCIFRRDVPACQAATKAPQIPSVLDCKKNPNGSFGRCQKSFFICQNGKIFAGTCPKGELFSGSSCVDERWLDC